MTEPDWESLPNFTRAEFECRCGCGRADMSTPFMKVLQSFRDDCGFPFTISSGYRCPDHNKAVSSTGHTGPHTTGKACDIRISGERAYELLQKAMAKGFSGVGVNQRGAHSGRFIHLDMLSSPHPRPRVWGY